MLIGTKRLDEEKVAVLIADIRRKKELTELSEEFVREHVLEFLEQEHKAASMLLQQFNPRSAVYKKLIGVAENCTLSYSVLLTSGNSLQVREARIQT